MATKPDLVAIRQALELAYPRHIAARRGGITHAELKTLWHEHARLFEDAEADGETWLLDQLRACEARDTAKWTWQLERKYPHRYADRIKAGVSEELAKIGQALADGLTPEEYEKVRAIISGRESVAPNALPDAVRLPSKV
jgi:hypothetical protein